MTDTVGLRLLTVTLTHYPPSAANLRQISPHATFMRPIIILFTTLPSGGFRGGSGGSLETPFGSKLFHFHGEMYEKSGKMLKTNPLLMDLNPPSRNPGSAPASRVPRKVVTYDWSTKYKFLALFKFQPIKFALTSVVGIFYHKENESRTFVSGVKIK